MRLHTPMACRRMHAPCCLSGPSNQPAPVHCACDQCMCIASAALLSASSPAGMRGCVRSHPGKPGTGQSWRSAGMQTLAPGDAAGIAGSMQQTADAHLKHMRRSLSAGTEWAGKRPANQRPVARALRTRPARRARQTTAVNCERRCSSHALGRSMRGPLCPTHPPAPQQISTPAHCELEATQKVSVGPRLPRQAKAWCWRVGPGEAAKGHCAPQAQ